MSENPVTTALVLLLGAVLALVACALVYAVCVLVIVFLIVARWPLQTIAVLLLLLLISNGVLP